jgi:hypothetical protein
MCVCMYTCKHHKYVYICKYTYVPCLRSIKIHELNSVFIRIGYICVCVYVYICAVSSVNQNSRAQ